MASWQPLSQDDVDDSDNDNQPALELQIRHRPAPSSSLRSESDPKLEISNLRQALRTAAQLAPLRTRTRDFYEKQNELIETYGELSSRTTETEDERLEREANEELAANSNSRLDQIAMWASFCLGVPLVLLTITAFFLSGSQALLATALDSVLDQLSQLIMLGTLWIMKVTKSNKALFPAGNSRLEPLGLVVFSSVMMTAFFELVISSIQDLISKAEVKVDTTVGIIVATNIVIKGSLWLFCIIVHRQTGSSSVEAFAQDHRNDVLVNCLAIGAMLLANWLAWWVDGVVAILLSCYIIGSWASTLFDVLKQLSGTAGPSSLQSAVLFLAQGFHPSIQAVESVRCYHLSENFIVELDIILPSTMPLAEAHDIGEALQHRIEEFPNVERAFVHLDVDADHYPEHEGRPPMQSQATL